MADVIAYLTVSNVIKLLRSYFASKEKPNIAEYVGDVTGLNIYPVKSMGGVQLHACDCTQRGIKYQGLDIFDRNFMIVNANGKFIHGNLIPKLSTIRCDILDDCIALQHDSMPVFSLPLKPEANQLIIKTKVWEEPIQGYDCGDDVAEWINTCLGSSNLRLIHCSQGLQKRELNKQRDKWKVPAKNGDAVTYQDEFPVMLASQTSLDDVNRKTKSDINFTMNRFRPNIVVSGQKPFDEVTTIDPMTGKKDKDQEPLTTLRKYRLDSSKFGKSPLFGIYLVINSPGSSQINVGDPVYVTRKQNQTMCF